jgi:acetoin utilization deacetylase AcuC-like enzyme
MRVTYSSYYSIELEAQHQFPMAKYRGVYERLMGEGTVAPHEVMTPGPASEEELLRVHTADYVRRFLTGELAEREERRLGFRWSPALCRRALHATGGSIMAARAALSDGLAANLAGGSHHAFPGHGEGYCAFHDMAVALRALRAEGFAGRLAIVDCDVHQGNGSAAILGGDPLVHTLSIHCDSNYPREKVPGSCDVGLADGVGDGEYLSHLERELERIWGEFRPELVFYQAGVDPLAGDRLGRLKLTRAGLRKRDTMVLRRCVSAGVPAAIFLGGGYGFTLEETVEAHADTIRIAAGLLAGRRQSFIAARDAD